MKKRAQVQFMEMIFVLLILIVIIFVGMIIYYSFLNKGLKETGERFTDIDAIILTDSVSSMAELTYETGVINSIKLFSLANILNSSDRNYQKYKDYYKGFFGNDKKVMLEIIYPQVKDFQTDDNEKLDCTTGDIVSHFNNDYPNNKCQKFTIYDPSISPTNTNKEVRKNPVSVYYPLKDEYKIGVLTIEVYKLG